MVIQFSFIYTTLNHKYYFIALLIPNSKHTIANQLLINIYIYTHTHTHTQVHLNKLECPGKVHLFQ